MVLLGLVPWWFSETVAGWSSESRFFGVVVLAMIPVGFLTGISGTILAFLSPLSSLVRSLLVTINLGAIVITVCRAFELVRTLRELGGFRN